MSQAAKGGGKGGASKGKKAGKSGAADQKGDDVLQAVIIADSFQERYMPFTAEKPRCLLPLAGVPLIEYTLEFLASNGVQEVYVYVGAHATQVEAYLAASRWWTASPSSVSPFASLEVVQSGARSAGDFLRHLDKRAVVDGDFVLVQGDLVANLSLAAPLRAHKARREANRDAIMTLVLRAAATTNGASGEAEEEHRTRMNGITPVFVVDPREKRVLAYDEVTPLQPDRYLRLEEDMVRAKDHPELEVRADLVDCEVDICTPDVLALWSESFDYELPRRNFLHGILKDFELNGKTVHAEIIEDPSSTADWEAVRADEMAALAAAAAAPATGGGKAKPTAADPKALPNAQAKRKALRRRPAAARARTYAARARNLQMYDSISQDVLGRWTFPFVPDNNLLPGQTFKLGPGPGFPGGGDGGATSTDVSAEDGVQIAPTSIVRRSAVGRDTVVGAGAVVTDCFVGRRVVVGKGARLERCYIWDDAVIGAGAVVERSVVANGASVGADAYVPPGSLLSFGVAVGAGVRLPASLAEPIVLSRVRYDGRPVDADDTALLGAEGKGAPFDDAEAAAAASLNTPGTTGTDYEESEMLFAADAAVLQKSLIYSVAHLDIAPESVSCFSDDDDDDALYDADSDADSFHAGAGSSKGKGKDAAWSKGGASSRARHMSFASDASGPSVTSTGGGGSHHTFHADAVSGLVDALRAAASSAADDFASAKLEFMGLRLANNAHEAAVRRAVASAVVRRAAELLLNGPGAGQPPLDAAKAADRTLTVGAGGAVAKFVAEVGVGVGDDNTPDQVEFALALQRAVVALLNKPVAGSSASSSAPGGKKKKHSRSGSSAGDDGLALGLPDAGKGGALLAALLQQLYALDVLEEEGILAWWADERAAGGQKEGSGSDMDKVREKCRVLVEWLENADEEDDDDEDEEDDE